MKEVLCSGQAFSLEFPYPGGSAALHWNPMGEHGELTASLCYDGAYGMGEKYNAVNQKGRTAVNEVEEKFCFQGEKTYCPAPFCSTNRSRRMPRGLAGSVYAQVSTSRLRSPLWARKTLPVL